MEADDLRRVNEALRSRLFELSEASRRINESLEIDSVLQLAVDGARVLTGAQYGALTLLNVEGQLQDIVTSGLSPEEHQQLLEMPDGQVLREHFNSIPGPLRIRNLRRYLMLEGLPEFQMPVEVGSCLAVPILNQKGVALGNIVLTKRTDGGEFTPGDEEILVLFASQAATAIVNARRYGDERRAKVELEDLVRTSPAGILVVDAKTGDFLLHNEEAKRIVRDVGIPERNVRQLHEMMSFFGVDGREIASSELPLRRAAQGEITRSEEVLMRLPDGRDVPILTSAKPVFSEDGEVASIVSVTQDMTPLEELERLRAEFLGMVSHELRTPLTSIKGSATTLLNESSELDPAEVRQFYRIIDAQADRMRELITDLLDLGRIETGTFSITPEPSEVAALVDEARNTFLSGGGRHNVIIDIAADLPDVMADRRRIVQVLGNLLSNAAGYSPQSSAIRVSAAENESQVEISISDEGVGIPTERLPLLFLKFSRTGGAAGIPGATGTGLGLAICKSIVEAHGGRIWVDSEGEDQGSRFTFTIPVVDQAVTSTESSRLPAVSIPQRTEEGSVLVVDDDPQTLRHVRDILSQAGYTALLAANSEEALEMLRRRPNVAILDFMLPGKDGIELMEDIRAITDIPVVFLSAYGQAQFIARALEMGAADYVVKPFSPTELVARIRVALRTRVESALPEQTEPYVNGDLTIDYERRLVFMAGDPVRLTVTEYSLLYELSRNAGRALSHDYLILRIWGSASSSDPRLVRTHIRRLRRKLRDEASNPVFIFTEPRVGYRMASPDMP